MSAHSPAPWMAAAKPSSIVGWPVCGVGGRAIASMHLAHRPADCTDEAWAAHYGEVEANARLIASAPDFLASAQSLLEAWDARTTRAQQIITGKSDSELQKQAADAMQGLRAAIAKATGA